MPAGAACTKNEFLSHLFSVIKSNKISYFIRKEFYPPSEIPADDKLDITVQQSEILRMVLLLNDFMKQYKIRVVSYYTDKDMISYRLESTSETAWQIQLNVFCRRFSFRQNSITHLRKVALLLVGVKAFGWWV